MSTTMEQGSIQLIVATTFWSRLKGLLGTNLNESAVQLALLIPHCRSVHTFGMRYALDIAFVSDKGVVLRAERAVKPNRLLFCKGASYVLERARDASNWWFTAGDNVTLGSRKRVSEQQ